MHCYAHQGAVFSGRGRTALPACRTTGVRNSFPCIRPSSSRHPRSLHKEEDALPPLVEQLLRTPGLEAPQGKTPEQMLKITEAYWRALKDPAAAKPPPVVVKNAEADALFPEGAPEFDVCVAGGTLGIIIALALQQRGHRVAVVERRLLQGRTQEWNTSDRELAVLMSEGLITADDLKACISTRWEADRIGFSGGDELWVHDVLNIGVSPKKLIAALKRRFVAAGGVLAEQHAFKSAAVFEGYGVVVGLTPGSSDSQLSPADVNRPKAVVVEGAAGAAAPVRRRQLTARLLLDCMGHFSPIVKQIRNGQQPDGMVLVVGGCFDYINHPATPAASADLLYSISDSFDDSQLFWEAFPSEGGKARTVYMFEYADTHPSRPSFSKMLDTFIGLLPKYQGIGLDDVKFKRVLVGGFPCYLRSSPLPPAFDRVLQIGDAAAGQSPLSFGGFGAMLRHLPRLTRGLDEALQQDRLRRSDLGWLQSYQPSLSASWLFQRAMSVKVGQLRPVDAAEGHVQRRWGFWLPADHINRLLKCNFAVMRLLGDRVLRPFVQDAMQVVPLWLTMMGMMLKDPIAVATVLFHVGPLMILGWFRHFIALVSYAALHALLRPLRSVWKGWFAFQRFLDALEVGSASDYHYYPGKFSVKRAVEWESERLAEAAAGDGEGPQPPPLATA